MKDHIIKMFLAECIQGNATTTGQEIIEILMDHIQGDEIESALIGVINACKIDPNTVTAQLSKINSSESLPDSSEVEPHLVFANEYAKSVTEDNIPYCEVNDFIATLTDTAVNRFIATADTKAILEHMLGIADFGENIVTQTGSIEPDFSNGEHRAQQTLYWQNDNPDEDDISGDFTIYLSKNGLTCAAGIDGNDIDIVNYKEMIQSAAEAFSIPEPLINL